MVFDQKWTLNLSLDQEKIKINWIYKVGFFSRNYGLIDS